MLSIGVDIGGTNIRLALIDDKGKKHHFKCFETNPSQGMEAILQNVVAAIQEFQSLISTPLVGIGIGIPGQVNKKGEILLAPNLKWHNIPLQEKLSNILLQNVIVDNDVRLAALGEWKYGAGKGSTDIVCMFVGTGIGSGVVCGGKLLYGFNNAAGEIGHMSIDRQGPVCSCGATGCLEAFAGGWAIAKRAQNAINKNPSANTILLKLCGGNIHTLTAKHVSIAAQNTDPLAESIVQETTNALIIGATNIVHAFNPQRLILGGGVVEGMPDLIFKIEQGVRKNALKALSTGLEVLPAQLGSDAGVIGAGCLAFEKFGPKN